MTPHLIAVMGPTASGKTEIAEELAVRIDAQLVNADAFQVYRGMDIGTSKPPDKAKYRLLDIKDPSEGFGVGEFVTLALDELARIWAIGRHAIVVGGTGLYIRALFEEYSEMTAAPDPELRAELNLLSLDDLVAELMKLDALAMDRVDLRNRVRVQRQIERIKTKSSSLPVMLPPFRKLKFAILRDPSELSVRITRRVERMVSDGWAQEVLRLSQDGVSLHDPGMRAIGYQAMWEYISGNVDLDKTKATTIADTRRYAKRQRTWLRSEPGLVELDYAEAADRALRFVV